MTEMDALKIRAARALELIRTRGTVEQWEKIVETIEAQAVEIAKQPPPAPSNRPANWWRLP